jgi:hypothetical protein
MQLKKVLHYTTTLLHYSTHMFTHSMHAHVLLLVYTHGRLTQCFIVMWLVGRKVGPPLRPDYGDHKRLHSTCARVRE